MKIGLELYKKAETNNTNNEKPIYSIDLEKDIVGNDEQKEKFIRAWLYGDINNNDIKEDIEGLKRFGIFLFSDGRQKFYETIKGKKFKESLGVYYQEELDFIRTTEENKEGQGTETTGTPDTNKTKKRVITYQEIV